jgi:hypothetical protein
MGLLGLPSAILAQQYSNEKIKMMQAEQPGSDLTTPLIDYPKPADDGTDTGNRDDKSGKPAFKSGGFVPSGSSHSQGGIGLWDNRTKRYLGEMESGEPILSRVTYANNKPLIDRLLHSSMHRNGAKIYRDGGLVNYLQSPASTRPGYYKNGGRAGFNFDGSLEESRSITQRSLQGMDDLTEANKATASGVSALLELLSPVNGLLGQIRDKPSGISLHDLNTALYTAVDANKKSDL